MVVFITKFLTYPNGGHGPDRVTSHFVLEFLGHPECTQRHVVLRNCVGGTHSKPLCFHGQRLKFSIL